MNQTRTEHAHMEMNVPLMRRVAEVLMSYDPQAYGSVDLDARGTTITLKGRVVGDDAYRQALELARTTRGVNNVVDRLRVTVTSRPKPKADPLAVSLSAPQPPRPMPTVSKFLLVATIISMFSAAGFQAYSALREPEPEIPAPPPRPAVVRVEGSIYFERRPASGARLVFCPLNNTDGRARRAFALAGFDGKFALTTFSHEDGAVPGSYLVTVDWVPPPPPGADPEKYADIGNLAPKRFQHLETTPLRATIQAAPGGAVVKLAPFHMNRSYDARTGL